MVYVCVVVMVIALAGVAAFQWWLVVRSEALFLSWAMGHARGVDGCERIHGLSGPYQTMHDYGWNSGKAQRVLCGAAHGTSEQQWERWAKEQAGDGCDA